MARNASERLERASLFVAGAFLVVNVALILLSVVTRYVLRSSLMWTEELARYCLIYAVMIGAGAALKKGDHMAIEFVERRLPAPVAQVAAWAKRAVLILVFALMIYRGWLLASKAWGTRTLGLGIPRAVPLIESPRILVTSVVSKRRHMLFKNCRNSLLTECASQSRRCLSKVL